MKEVTVYTTDPCRRCGNAKAILERYDVSYEEVNLSKDPVGRAELAQRTGLMTFPQIVVGDETIGGLDDLRAADEDGRLAALFAP
ncbi:MAG: glutaredoxin 3 [Solirubrobacteraceae bacterium]|nr:glutaredoxin 3 [Solirubrobacteraceae bacterium]